MTTIVPLCGLVADPDPAEPDPQALRMPAAATATIVNQSLLLRMAVPQEAEFVRRLIFFRCTLVFNPIRAGKLRVVRVNSLLGSSGNIRPFVAELPHEQQAAANTAFCTMDASYACKGRSMAGDCDA
jgi:hypothetical protein